MNVNKELNHPWLEAVPPPFLRPPEYCPELIGQFFKLGEMVKLTRMGETHQLKPVVCIEIMLYKSSLGLWNTWLLWEKNTWLRMLTPGERLGAGAPPKSHGTNVID